MLTAAQEIPVRIHLSQVSGAARQSGLTLIEILVTLVIMAVGLLGLAGLQSAAIKGSADISQRSQALWLANSLADRMRANTEGIGSYASLSTSSCSAPATNCSDHGANVSGSACTPTQIATFDVWEVACGQAAAANTLTNAVDSLDVTAVNISKTTMKEQDISNTVYTVSVVYNSKLVNNSKVLSASARSAQQSQTVSVKVVPTYAP